AMVLQLRTPGEQASPIAYGLRRWKVPELKMELVWLEPRTFTMGGFAGEVGRGPEGVGDQGGLARGVWSGTDEVTEGQVAALMKTNPSATKGDDVPVESVSWEDANDFCAALQDKLAGMTGRRRTVRLPTESEWEYACRAGTSTAYAGADLAELGWFDGNS